MPFAHLHVHSDASRIDGLGPVDNLVLAAKDLGFKSLAITDHGSLANTISFMASCTAAGVKPILGMEGYVAVDNQTMHITLLADGNEGFSSLVKLNNIGQASKYNRPAFAIDDLVAHNRGLSVLTGCIASPFHNLPYNEALKLGKYLMPHFEGRLFAEAMIVGVNQAWIRANRLSHDLQIPPIVTNDVHYTYPSLKQVHTVLTHLKAGFGYESSQLYLATEDELRTRALGDSDEAVRLFDRGLRNAGILANKLASPVFSSRPTLPSMVGGQAKLRQLCIDAALARPTPGERQAWTERLDYELGVIEAMGFVDYFVILIDIVAHARRSGVRIGPGRGSAAGSLVLYATGVTDTNPLEYGLSFERFLNPQRTGMPDVDVDFDSRGRQSVIDYAASKWGASSVATYSRYSHKVLVHDLSKYFKIERDVEAELAESGASSKKFSLVAEENPLFANSYAAMLGQIRHIGQHAGGVIITDLEVPLERTSDRSQLVAAWTEGEDKQLSSVGIVKYDLLGLSALSVLKDLETRFGKHAEPLEPDDPVFELFKSGDLDGIFQFSGSQGIADYTKRVSPRTFDDLVAINALYRPGALDAGTAELFPARQQRLLHPLIDPLLEETFGIIVYQEQVMSVYAAVTGGDLATADLARRVIVKSHVGDPEWELEMAQLAKGFFKEGKQRGLDDAILTQLWNELGTHARYSFNKSHAVAYARIAAELAWWKFHHPVDFYAATINSDPSESDRFVYSAATRGIAVVPPHVNHSSLQWEAGGGKLYMPLTAVKFMGETGASTVVDGRPYVSVADFTARIPRRVVRANVRRALEALGSFDGLPDAPPRPAVVDEVAFLGFRLPTKRIIDEIELVRKGGWAAGLVVDVERRESNYGVYYVYKLSPNGAFWVREEEPKYAKGDIVAARVDAKTGRAKITKQLRLGR